MPTLTVFAGPNGSGKSSVTKHFDFDGKDQVLDPDAIAKRMNPSDPTQSAIAAGREVILRTRSYIDAGQSFAIETTLSGNWTLTAMRAALKQGYVIRVVYICVDNPELNIRRVRERVSHGGHDVPDDDVRRRYARSLANIPEVLRIANQGFVFDNSLNEPRKMLETDAGVIIWRATDQPSWVMSLIENLS